MKIAFLKIQVEPFQRVKCSVCGEDWIISNTQKNVDKDDSWRYICPHCTGKAKGVSNGKNTNLKRNV